MAPVDDLELTVYKSKFNVLQACALEELDFSFKQDSPAEFAEPSLSETITDNFVEEKPHVGLCRFDMCDQEIEDIPYSSGLTSYISAINGAEASLTESVISSRDLERGENDSELVVEAKMIEDSDSAFKHASEMVISNSITPSVNPKPMITHPLDNVVEIISHEVEKTSGLLFLEAKSVEDINSFFEAATKEVPAMPVFCSSDLDSARTHADSEEVELSSPDAETSSELFVLEAKSAEDIQLAFKESIEGVSMMPSSSLVDPNLIKATQGLEVVESMCGDINDDSKLLVLEGKSSKDIDSVFKQFDFEKMITHSNVKVEDDDNAENDTKRVSLGKKLIAVTSAFQEAIDQDSDKSTFHQDVYSLNAISAEDINLNSTLEQDNEDSPAHSSSQDGPELGYVHPSHEDVEKESLRAEDKSEIYSLESKTFEVAHLDFKEASTDYFCPNQEQVVLDEKSPDFGNTSNFFVTETKSLEDDEVYDVKESSFASDNSSELIAVEGKSFVTIHSALSEDTNAVCEVSSSLSADPKPMKTPPARKGDNMCTEAENNSDILLIEAKSFEDIVSAFKLATIAPPSPQPTDAMALHSERASSLVLHEEGSTIPIFSIDPPYDEFMEENSLRNKDSKLLVLEEISVKDIDSALEQVSGKYHGRSVTLEDDSKLKTRELQHKDSELFIVEQISVSDSDVIVKQDTEEGNKETATSKTEDGSTSDETVIRTSEKKMDKRTDEEEILSAEKEVIVTENPGFSAPISLKMKKKEKKYEKSDSSSSSSSSSSDTE